jgi:S1-C subfamily serine protease
MESRFIRGAIAATAVLLLAGTAASWHYLRPARASQQSVDTTSAEIDSLVKVSHASSELPRDAPPPLKLPSPDATAATSIEELVAHAMPAVVMVEVPDGEGSGFFVSEDTVITNKHVVESNENVTLRRSAGGTLAARVVSSSWDIDLAVLKVAVVDPSQPFLPLAGPADVKQGEEVIAIGSPMGLQNSVTRGIVSSMREVDGISLIQTDAAINPGNSGGPLIDRQGRVIGVNTWKLAGRSLQSLGFSVSIYYVRRMLGDDFALKSERELQRHQQLEQFERTISGIATAADEVDRRWKGFRSSCIAAPDGAEISAREWLALSTSGAGAFTLHDVARCIAWRQYFSDAARQILDAVGQAEARAAAAGVSVDQTRRVRRKYKMDWTAAS